VHYMEKPKKRLIVKKFINFSPVNTLGSHLLRCAQFHKLAIAWQHTPAFSPTLPPFNSHHIKLLLTCEGHQLAWSDLAKIAGFPVISNKSIRFNSGIRFAEMSAIVTPSSTSIKA